MSVMKKKASAGKRLSRLGRYLRDHDIRPLELADLTGISRQHLYRLRYGRMDATRNMMLLLTAGCRAILGRKRVRVGELFDLGGGRP
jgi:DNA-binding Xre family transcriptional regulator